MPNTSKKIIEDIWIEKQEAFIASLKSQPLVIVIRIQDKDNLYNFSNNILFKKIEALSLIGIKHIEIAWSASKGWIELIQYLQKNFPTISFGAASITTDIALETIIKLRLPYAMSPFWDRKLQEKARESNQVLIPGVFTPTEIQKTQAFGCKIIKLFPASNLGINYLQRITPSMSSLPFVIAAGGITPNHLNEWLNAGYDAVALGRKILQTQESEKYLIEWLHKNRTSRSLHLDQELH